jgi:catalase
VGFTSYRESIAADKVRGKAERFADHYTQATLFWNSQTPIEKAHILRGFRFELTRVAVPAVRKRVVAMLANVDGELAATLARQLGMPLPDPLPRALQKVPAPEITVSAPLSLFSNPGEGGISTRRVAIMVADGTDGAAAKSLHAGLVEEGAVPRYLGVRLGAVQSEDGEPIEVDATFETLPSVLFDALVVPGGPAAIKALANLGHAVEFIKDQYRHAKPILVLGKGRDLLEGAGVPPALPSGAPDPGVLVGEHWTAAEALAEFIKALASHRHYEREMDPPGV